MRAVPKFLTRIAEAEDDERAKVLPLLYLVLDNAAALEKARRRLLGIAQTPTP